MEKILFKLIEYLTILSEFLALFVILIGIIKAFWIFIKDIFFAVKARDAIIESRVELGHSFSLGLGFLIGASILNTIVAPNWDDIGKLVAIIFIRTILNFFLLNDTKDNEIQIAENDKKEKNNKDINNG